MSSNEGKPETRISLYFSHSAFLSSRITIYANKYLIVLFDRFVINLPICKVIVASPTCTRSLIRFLIQKH